VLVAVNGVNIAPSFRGASHPCVIQCYETPETMLQYPVLHLTTRRGSSHDHTLRGVCLRRRAGTSVWPMRLAICLCEVTWTHRVMTCTTRLWQPQLDLIELTSTPYPGHGTHPL